MKNCLICDPGVQKQEGRRKCFYYLHKKMGSVMTSEYLMLKKILKTKYYELTLIDQLKW